MTPSSIRSSSVYRRHGLQSYIVQVYQFVDVVTLNVYIYHHFLISKPTNNGTNDTGPGCTVGRKWENKFLSNSLFSICRLHLLTYTYLHDLVLIILYDNDPTHVFWSAVLECILTRKSSIKKKSIFMVGGFCRLILSNVALMINNFKVYVCAATPDT